MFVVCYKDAENVLQKEHVLDGVQLSVRPHNPIPDDPEGAKPVPEKEGIHDGSKKLVIRHVEEDLPKGKLHLLEASGFCERLENERKHLRITVEASSNRMIVEGAKVELQVVTTELLRFLAKTKEQVIKLPKRLRAVLISPNGSRFLQQAFQEHNIVAVLVPEQMKSANEVLIVSQTDEHTEKAEELIQNAFQECSLPLRGEHPRYERYEVEKMCLPNDVHECSFSRNTV